MSTTLSLTITARAGASFVGYLRRHVRAAHGLLRTRLRELSVVLVADRMMSEIHRRTMKITGPTDVLTFPLDLDARGRPLSGEIVLCVPEARRRARQLGTEPRDELLLYAIHGMLHLSGFDDRTRPEFERMHRTEDRILSRLGVGAVFSPRPKPPATLGSWVAKRGRALR